jgi:orotidine-5'-phosphate decarboxylase
MLAPKNRLAFALDYPTLEEAHRGAEQVCDSVGVLKVGLELFIQEGPAAVKMAQALGCQVFLDLKLHDIEKTVERAVGTASSLGARYLTIHTSGGPKMMEAAAKRAQAEGSGLCVLGVTVLTSLDEADLTSIGIERSPALQAERLARLARESGLGGLVCSSVEVASVRAAVGQDMLLVTPGIRPKGTAPGDQKRIGTPKEAIQKGADILVVGRPIRDAADPKAAARALLTSIEEATS